MRNKHGGWGAIGAALLAGLALGATLGVGVAEAASITTSPTTVAPGGALTISGADWVGTVTLVFVKGNTVLQAGSADAGPNGGPISVTRSAPTEPGAWQVCADGQNLLDGQAVSQCANVTVAAPTTATAKPATTTIPPTTTPDSATTSTTTIPPTTTTTTTLPPTLPPTTAEAVPPSTSPVVTVPAGADGISAIDEGTSPAGDGGLSGLTIGLIIGVMVLTGIGVVGMLSSGVGSGPRPAGAVGVAVVGALLAGALAVFMPAPTANLPDLAATRVQASASLARGGAPSDIVASCPTGNVVIGGGYRTTWASATIDDTRPLIGWMETYRDTASGALTYVYDRGWTTRLSSDGLVSSAYWRTARLDGTVHFSDFVWPSGQASWGSANVEGLAGDTIRWNPVWADAMRDIYYRTLDQSAQTRQVGVLVAASMPVEQGWRVSLQLPDNSLQSSVDVQVVAVCAPPAVDGSADGVLGAHIVSGATKNGRSTAACPSGERALAIGWRQNSPGGVSAAALGDDGSSVTYEGDVDNAGAAVAVCASASVLEVTSATASGGARGGTDGSVVASCPTGTVAVSGGTSVVQRTSSGDTFSNSHTIIAAVPTGTRTFGVGFRGLLTHAPFGSDGPSLNDEAPIVTPHASYTQVDESTVEAIAVCARRVVAGS